MSIWSIVDYGLLMSQSRSMAKKDPVKMDVFLANGRAIRPDLSVKLDDACSYADNAYLFYLHIKVK